MRPTSKSANRRQVGTKKRSIETKMVYQYPKGEFRFPVIPDQPAKNESVKSQDAKRPASFRIENAVPVVKKEEPIVKKKPFQATEVPSPVFAFQKRPSNFEFTLRKTESTEEKAPITLLKDTDFEVEATEPSIQEKAAILNTDGAVLSNQSSESLQDEQAFSTQPQEVHTKPPIVLAEEFGHTEKTVDVSESFSESGTLQEEQKNIQQETEIANKEAVPEDTEKPQPVNVSKRIERLSKPRIPFNVMMVNQDRAKENKRVTADQEDLHTQLDGKATASSEKTTNTTVVSEAPKTETLTSSANGHYRFPSLALLKPPVFVENNDDWLDQQEELLNETLLNFNVQAHVVNRTQGPAVTRFEVQPEKGVKVSRITNLSDDIKLSLAAKDIRIEAPIPGKSTVGIEIPNQHSRPVMISEIMKAEVFQKNPSPLTAALGLDISGNPIATDLQKMPHGLIAGATGSGKSVCINSLLVSLLYKARPDQLKLLLIDPKMVELAPYNRIPHLVSPVITDAKAATAALKWAVEEMERRYQLFSHTGVRNMEKYNEYASHPEHSGEKLPYILIVIDELADLMMVAPNDVEESISRIAQKARACGIHMIVATQRPSVDVITGLIKANIPTRISFSVSSSIDSRTILDATGAEKLLGKGDMLFLPNGTNKPVRLQGTYVSDEEIDAVVLCARKQGEPNYLFEEKELLAKESTREAEDELFDDACDFVLKQNAASTSLLQRHFRIGYNRAARLMDALEEHSVVSGTNGSKPRDVIITHEQLHKLREKREIPINSSF
ncbi:DNA translocase FtsK [Listeria ilorinensis]|uniref:DNA translocase FtsK n=1 Tax=Listeria ilorinensis TaxID=2867439 RepID=UPI003EB8D4DB